MKIFNLLDCTYITPFLLLFHSRHSKIVTSFFCFIAEIFQRKDVFFSKSVREKTPMESENTEDEQNSQEIADALSQVRCNY